MYKYRPTRCNFANDAVWYTILFKVSVFPLFWPKTKDCNCLFQKSYFLLNPNNHYSRRTVEFDTLLTVYVNHLLTNYCTYWSHNTLDFSTKIKN